MDEHDLVHAGPHLVPESRERRAVERGPGHAIVAALGHDLVALASSELAELGDLRGQPKLFGLLRAHARVGTRSHSSGSVSGDLARPASRSISNARCQRRPLGSGISTSTAVGGRRILARAAGRFNGLGGHVPTTYSTGTMTLTGS